MINHHIGAAGWTFSGWHELGLTLPPNTVAPQSLADILEEHKRMSNSNYLFHLNHTVCRFLQSKQGYCGKPLRKHPIMTQAAIFTKYGFITWQTTETTGVWSLSACHEKLRPRHLALLNIYIYIPLQQLKTTSSSRTDWDQNHAGAILRYLTVETALCRWAHWGKHHVLITRGHLQRSSWHLLTDPILLKTMKNVKCEGWGEESCWLAAKSHSLCQSSRNSLTIKSIPSVWITMTTCPLVMFM